ncbi:alpha/beta fold hydrolase [Fretibacter rubidus]|uniref:alpha/beta fold hydrolase n=1 Tax=Fretibacter rubidus TaxID=570162 RepID=UPI003529D8E8
MIRKIAGIGMTLVMVYIGYFYLTHSPFPDSKARPAIGETIIIQSDSRVTSGITYYVSGPDAPAKRVVLSASAGREASDFNELVTALNAQGYRTLAVEHGGINGAPTVEAADMALLAFPLIKALEHDGYMNDTETFAFIGHGFGNRIVRAASDYYARIEGTLRPNAVVLLTAGGATDVAPEMQEVLDQIFDPRVPFKARKTAMQNALFAEGDTIPDHWTRGWHTQTAVLQRRAKTNKIEQWENAGGVPMLVVQPAQDRIAPKSDAGDYLAAKFPDQVTLTVVEDAGHALLPERPDAVAKAVIDYLATVMIRPEVKTP